MHGFVTEKNLQGSRFAGAVGVLRIPLLGEKLFVLVEDTQLFGSVGGI
jgi:hypothetical protein